MARLSTTSPAAYVTFTLHSHLPYVVNHGTWPHGLEWLHEAAAETYLPLLRVVGELEAQGIFLRANVNLSPILLEQLAHPVFKAEFPKYVQRKIDSARVDQQTFVQEGERHLAEVAEFWLQFFQRALDDFKELGGDIIGRFRQFNDSGAIEVITCAATHGYAPLLGFDSCIRAQIATGVATHKKYFGKQPRGIWLPECGYRPAGSWNFPVPFAGQSTVETKPFYRDGVEQFLAENGIEYFFVDTHLVETSAVFTPYEMMAGGVVPSRIPIASEIEGNQPHPSLYEPYYADTLNGTPKVSFFPRDPKTGIQVWSGDMGYPGDPCYLDFHKKRWPGGHRYWQVTDSKADLGAKTAYYPQEAKNRTKTHAAHFVHLTRQALNGVTRDNGAPPILTAPFDAELFGHWWFEGPEWLRQVAIEYARPESQIKLISCGDYLSKHRPSGALAIAEGSWGKNGTNEVWLNPENNWTWTHIYPAEKTVRQMARAGRWKGDATAIRLAKQTCRELLLLESSDWQFLITTEAARDYAEKRFNVHLEQLRALIDAWRRFESVGQVSPECLAMLEKIEDLDGVFSDVNPDLWAEEPSRKRLSLVR